ncbi:MAG TPA: hypothetical protein VLV30_05685 [Methanomicrobiales archaeon]|nr:hypothetical protein [Methanomicrobiales archaeon]
MPDEAKPTPQMSPEDQRRAWREERREWRRKHRGPFLIPAGLLIGLGVGILANQPGAGLLIGLGLGLVGSAFLPMGPGGEPAHFPVHGARWAFVLVGAFLVLLGLALVSGWALPWTYVAALLLVLIGIWFIVRGIGRMW